MSTARLSIVCASLSLLTVAGCGSSQEVDYTQAYQQGRFTEAHSAAAAEAARADGIEADRAALIAGLAAHASGDNSEALLRLRPLTRSADREIAGTAGATVGLIEFDRSRYEEAAAALSDAADKLEGRDASRARAHAALAYERAGNRKEAANQRRLALQPRSGGDAWDSRVAHRNGAYTIQLGAFSNRSRAARLVERTRTMTAERGLGQPRVVIGRGSGGETLYLVQVGEFRSKFRAELAQDNLGVTSVIADAPVN